MALTRYINKINDSKTAKAVYKRHEQFFCEILQYDMLNPIDIDEELEELIEIESSNLMSIDYTS